MGIKVKKKCVDYEFFFGGILPYNCIEEVEDAIYEMKEVDNIKDKDDSFIVIVKGKYDSPELLEKIKHLIQKEADMDSKRWKKERMRHMKKLHGLMSDGKETIYPRDLTEAMMWFVHKEFVDIPDTKYFAFLGQGYYLVVGNLYQHGDSKMTKLNPNKGEMEIIQSLVGG